MSGYLRKRPDRRIFNVLQVVALDGVLTLIFGIAFILGGTPVFTAYLVATLAGCLSTLCVVFGLVMIGAYRDSGTSTA